MDHSSGVRIAFLALQMFAIFRGTVAEISRSMDLWELLLRGILAVGLTGYLVYAMLRPEKF
jgi:K+-transporting ATPase KdpF subunit